jgi:hypothetical protein
MRKTENKYTMPITSSAMWDAARVIRKYAEHNEKPKEIKGLIQPEIEN